MVNFGDIVSAAPVHLADEEGVLLLSVRENSPADKAGLVRGDIVLAIDDEKVDDAQALAAAVLGSCLGFLFFNARPASIFMGDAGSLFLGLLLAVLGIKLRFQDNVSFVTWMVPLLVMGVPLCDTTLVVLSRSRRGVNPLTTAMGIAAIA